MPDTVSHWHALVASPERAELESLLAADAVFHSPAVHAPQVGRQLTAAYLWAAVQVLGPTIAYRREWRADHGAVLEFEAVLAAEDGRELQVHGVDIMEWDDAGLITDFTVMVRPRRALDVLIAHMREALEQG